MIGPFAGNGLLGSYIHAPDIAAEFGAEAFIGRMLAFERAWTEGLRDLGAVDARTAEAALAILEPQAVDLAALARGSERDGLPVPQMIADLRARAGEGARGLHQGATSQDVIDTAMVLTLRRVAEILRGRIAAAEAVLADLSGAHGHRDIMAYTRMQAARPIPAARRIAIWSGTLGDARDALDTSATALPVQIGGAVGLRDAPEGLGSEMAARVAARLGLPSGPVWHVDRAPIQTYAQALVRVTGALGKTGQDIALMAMIAGDDLRIAGGGTSSAMPHKQNPVEAEAMVALARLNAGLLGTLAQAEIAEMERSGTAMTLEWMVLPQMAEAAGCALAHAFSLLSRIERIGAPG